MSEQAIMANCPVHRVRPDWSCSRCLTAVDVNRMNRGWGARRHRMTDGSGIVVKWMTYQPFFSWFGREAFVTELPARA
jgi:hypothetical protein